jgi:hypothetical protein
MIALIGMSGASSVSAGGGAGGATVASSWGGVLTTLGLVCICEQPDTASVAISHPAARTCFDNPCVDAIRNIGSKVNLSRNIVATRGYGSR